MSHIIYRTMCLWAPRCLLSVRSTWKSFLRAHLMNMPREGVGEQCDLKWGKLKNEISKQATSKWRRTKVVALVPTLSKLCSKIAFNNLPCPYTRFEFGFLIEKLRSIAFLGVAESNKNKKLFGHSYGNGTFKKTSGILGSFWGHV